MFTGIITDLGRVRALSDTDGGKRLEIATGDDTASLDIGASVACSGVCLTVVETGPGWFAVEASAQTLSRTTIAGWRAETPVNLERPLKLGDEMGGHVVSGHVDGTGSIVSAVPDGESVRLTIEAPATLMPFIAARGSVALDGVSLTVNHVEGRRFGVNVIPHTGDHTTLGRVRQGDAVNLEIDPLARYVARLLEASKQGSGSAL